MRKITCTKCLKCFDTVKSLKHHFKSVHLDMKGFKCDHCGRKFRDRFSLNVHEQIHGNKLAPGVSNLCSMCGNVFVDEKSLKRHVGIVHSNKKSIKCIQCPKRFRDKYGLIRHLNKKHGEENKDETKDDGNNNSPMKMDENKENEAPRVLNKVCKVCPLCNKTVKRLNKHLKVKHAVNRFLNSVFNQNKFHCQHCGKPMRDSFNLERHEGACGKQQEISSFGCGLCPKSFTSKVNLKRHINSIHETPVNCEKCSVTFATKLL